jgi:hypothetical protein
MNPAFVIETEKVELSPLVANVSAEPMQIAPLGAEAQPRLPTMLNMPAGTVVSPV